MLLDRSLNWKNDCIDEKRPLFSCEKFTGLKIIGSKIVQVVSNTVDQLDFPAKEILSIDISLGLTSDHAFTNKVVKQGSFLKKISYCDECGNVRCQIFETPFTAVAEIPGVDPKMDLEIQNKLILAETDHHLFDPKTLREIVVLDIEIKVSALVQRKFRVCNSHILSLQQISR